ncbi:MAG TPA: DMT family transporter [Acidimicrobiales bacterium]|nr:DMT family transporter [Acidimicrobiales bacterium]
MDRAVLLALLASFCTATSSVCQRLGARAEDEVAGFDARLIFRLARRPIWLLGVAAMILGFVFQLTALHFGSLALVQPILATELLFVFAYMSILGSGSLKRRDWLAAGAMAAGLGGFLLAASPSGGHLHAPGRLWALAGLVTAAVVLAAVMTAFGTAHHPRVSPSHRAAILGAATGISWGFVAAVIKELSSHLGAGTEAVVSNWSLYVLIGGGGLSMLLASHALSAGPLAASQPGFTILDPLTASLLGLFLFNEHVSVAATDLAIEAAALVVLVAGVSALSHSQLVRGENGPTAALPDHPASSRSRDRGLGHRSAEASRGRGSSNSGRA